MNPEQIDQWAADVLVYVRNRFDGEGQVTPHALLLATLHPHTGEAIEPPVLAPVFYIGEFGDQGSKERFKRTIIDAGKSCGALAAVFIAEMWGDDGGESVLLAYDQRGRSGTKVWTIPIIRNGLDKPKLGDVREGVAMRGLLTGFLEQPN